MAPETALDKAIRLQNELINFAFRYNFEGGNAAYRELRRHLISRGDIKTRLPDFVLKCRDLEHFLEFIHSREGRVSTSLQARIRNAFIPLLEYLEEFELSPGVAPISDILKTFDAEHVHATWQKALDRRTDDPEGAITAARTLLETACKYILDDAGIDYGNNTDLPKLWSLAAEQTNLLPTQHQEEVFKTILGNCQAVVNNLAAIRNRVGDAHGQGRSPVKPQVRHAELAVNLAGTMASFLVATWTERDNS